LFEFTLGRRAFAAEFRCPGGTGRLPDEEGITMSGLFDEEFAGSMLAVFMLVFAGRTAFELLDADSPQLIESSAPTHNRTTRLVIRRI
jgi:hypothetical protein